MMSLNVDAVFAIWKRQIGSLLGNPLGYVYILAFVLGAGLIQFYDDSYFARNICDLGPLLTWMPWLLVGLLPALAMGSWALERELGTEEQLLTLPVGVFDALLGKWLGVATFFTIALLCCGYEVFVLYSLGEPDLGLIVANFAGWWLAGLALSAAGLFASTLVGLPAIAFVFGVIICAGLALLAQWMDWFDPFNRGLIPLSGVVSSLVVTALFLGLATLVLSSRRWQKALQAMILGQALILGCTAVTFYNLSVQAARKAVDLDVSSEGLSSLSSTSLEILKGIESKITIDAFISFNPPAEVAQKSKEVENFLKTLDREMGSKVKLIIRRPKDALDKDGIQASQHFGLTAKQVTVDSVTGKEPREIFLGAAISSGGKRQVIAYFDPGLSVEYELIRTIRTVAGAKKPVLGIASTDMKMLGGFDFQAKQNQPEWQIVQEWKKQYEVREVNLDAKVSDDIDVLVVPQPSRMSDAQIEKLHNYIWSGGPCLIMEDPLPYSQPEMGSSQDKKAKQQNPMMGMRPPPPEKKGDLSPLVKALGLDIDFKKVAWSDFNPSHEFRQMMPPNFVWTFKKMGGITDSASTNGVDSLLLPFPGFIREASDKSSELTVTPLVQPIEDVKWGQHDYEKHISSHPFFGTQRLRPAYNNPGLGKLPYIAVAVTGKMKRAYGLSDDKDEKKAPGAPATQTSIGKGKLGEKPVNVIWIADIDLAQDFLFQFYRNENKQFSKENLNFLLDLRNVQFLSNAVDSLAGDAKLADLRSRRPRRRSLSKIEDVLKKTQNDFRASTGKAQKSAESQIKKLRDDFKKRIEKIKEDTDIDESSKAQLVRQVEQSTQRQLDAKIEAIQLKTNQEIREGRVEQNREIKKVRKWIRYMAMGYPSAFLALLACGVFFFRRRNEGLIVPVARQRS